MNILDAIKTRASTRAFLDRAVDNTIIEQILDAARWAPSGTNTQPWNVAVVSGERKQQLCEALAVAHQAGQERNPDYRYYPEQWFEPYQSRRFACGMALYQCLGIAREDKAQRQKVWQLNYHAFGAPSILLFFIDRNLEQGSWFDYGMFFENVMLAALEYGLATCAQAALAEYPDIVRTNLGDEYHDKLLISGMALGYPDKTATINAYRTERNSVEDFTRWFE
jgi:nitroreductase